PITKYALSVVGHYDVTVNPSVKSSPRVVSDPKRNLFDETNPEIELEGGSLACEFDIESRKKHQNSIALHEIALESVAVKGEPPILSKECGIVSALVESEVENDEGCEEDDHLIQNNEELKCGIPSERHLWKSYVCEICDRRFTHAGSLKIHHLIHTGEKPFSCDRCGKKFRVGSHLKDHLLIHTGEKPHSCNVCGRTFTRAGSLKRHYLIHERDHSFVLSMK
ncbi:gastrula zinc finger protein XlCGF9.1-like, partial [Limulus polyphemus]|uniref:Gastrula zinc finger protein XlCGF9.1-like n=1 Tax=Limulus polyphemus TaxID=6850 RepID=A0ABM1SVS3_LIMPO